jgi:hypothetical protein
MECVDHMTDKQALIEAFLVQLRALEAAEKLRAENEQLRKALRARP